MYIYFWIYLEQYLLILPAGRFVLLVLFLDLTSETHWILVYIGWDFILDIYIEIFWWECNKMRWYWLDLIKHWYLFDQTFGHVGRDLLDFLICLHRTKQILCDILNTGLCWMRKTNYIKDYWTSRWLDENIWQDKFYQNYWTSRYAGWQILDRRICWITNIGREDFLDEKYWTVGFFGWKILDCRICWMTNIGR